MRSTRKRMVVLSITFLIAVTVAKIFAFQKQSSGNAKPAISAGTADAGPSRQEQLCKLFDEFNRWQPPPGESNPIKAASAPPYKEPDWNTKMHDIMGDGAFVNWKGKLHVFNVVANREISILVDLPCPAVTSFITVPDVRNTHYHFKIRSTQPKLGSEISNALSTMQPGDTVTISGTLLYWNGFYVPAEYETDDMRNALWPSEYHPDIGKRIAFGGHHFVVRFDKIFK
jgi:hypothetical protein